MGDVSRIEFFKIIPILKKPIFVMHINSFLIMQQIGSILKLATFKLGVSLDKKEEEKIKIFRPTS
jgi:hypothetical protein